MSTLYYTEPPWWNKYFLFYAVAILIIVLLASSCKGPQITQQTSDKDSLSYMERVVYRDTVLTLPGDTIRFHVPCDNDTVFIVEGKKSSSIVQVKDKKVSVQNNCDEQSLIITRLISEINTLKQQKSDSSKTVTVEVKFIPWWYKFTNKAFYVESLLLLSLLAIRFKVWKLIA